MRWAVVPWALALVAACAQQAPPTGAPAVKGYRVQALSEPVGFGALYDQQLALADDDGDGVIGELEGRPGWMGAEWTRLDADRDGRITRAEFAVFLERRRRTLPPVPLDGLASGTPMRAYLAYGGYLGADHYLLPTRDGFRAPPSSFGLAYEGFELRNAYNQRLEGWYVPAAVPTTKAVLVLHGLSSSKDWAFRTYGPWLQARYNVMTFDFRGHGGSEGSKGTLGYEELDEALLAVAALKARGQTRIGVIGMSLGGALAIRLGARSPDIRAVVNDCSFSTLPGMIVPRNQKQRYLWPESVSRAMILTMNRRTGLELEQADPVRVAAQVAPRPFLTIHGLADTAAPPFNAQEIYDAALAPKQLWLVPGAGHAANFDTAPEEFKQRVLALFDGAL